MCGRADRTAAVTTDAAHAAARSDCCRFTAARAAGGIVEIPGIGSFAIEEIVGLVSHKEFRSVGIAEEDRTGGFETCDDCCVGYRHVIFAEKGAGGTAPTGDVDAGFDGEWNSCERLCWFTARQGRLSAARARQSRFGIEMNEGVEQGLQILNPLEMGGNEFDGRELFFAEKAEGFRNRAVDRQRHRIILDTAGDVQPTRKAKFDRSVRPAPSRPALKP